MHLFLSGSSSLLFNGLDDTDGNGLLHVSDGESSKRRIVGESFNTHGLVGDEGNHSAITRLNSLGFLFKNGTSSSVNLFLDFRELAGNVSSVAIQDWAVTSTDLTGMVEDNNLGIETGSFLGGIVLGVTADVTSSDILDSDVLDVETDVVTGNGFLDRFVMHFDGLNFSSDVGRSEVNVHAWLKDTSFNSSDGDGTDTTDLVHILKGKSEWLVDGSLGGDDSIEGFEKSGALEPGKVGGLLEHVITVPSGDGDEGNLGGVVSDLLKVFGDFLLDFVESSLGPGDGLFVHLVDTDDHLLDTQSEGQESVFSGLSFLGDTSFEFTWRGGNHEEGNISLGGTGNHVLDEISMAGGINNGEVILAGFEFPEGDIDGDTSFSFSLELVQDPGVLERTLTEFVGFLLELFDGSLVNTTALVDQVTSRSGFTGIDVTDNDEVNVNFFLGHYLS
jgi:hypothetical protein